MKKFLSYLLMLILVASCLSIPAAANAEDWTPCASSASTALCLD